jgi:hypothetical protein
MRKLDWLLAGVIAVFLAGTLAVQALAWAIDRVSSGTVLVERLVSPRADSPMTAQCPTISLPRR